MKLRALLTSLGLSALFVVVYSATNWITTQRVDVGTWYYSWEEWIPFVPLMIVPYMSIDLFFVASPFLCRSREERTTLRNQIAFAILTAGACFLLFPLQLAHERPETEGVLGAIFSAFVAMDAPHNLLPSLHIALRMILVPVYHRRTRGVTRVAVHVWFSLIGLSTLLTHQHHVIDIAGGVLLGAVALHLFPSVRGASPESIAPRARNVAVGVRYLAGAGVCAGLATVAPPLSLILVWPAIALGIVGAAYLGIGGRVYRKVDGRLPLSTRLLLGPVLVGHELSRRYYMRECEPWNEVAPRVWIGRQLGIRESLDLDGVGPIAVLDMTSEFTEARALRKHGEGAGAYRNLPVLDLTAPSLAQLHDAVEFIEERVRTGRVYVHCKIGYSRSVAAVAAYLLASGEANSVEHAIERIREVRPNVVVRPEIWKVLREFDRTRVATIVNEKMSEEMIPVCSLSIS